MREVPFDLLTPLPLHPLASLSPDAPPVPIHRFFFGLLAFPVATARVGSRLGPYRIEAAIGEGGMGIVYKALDVRLNRPAAIKFLHDDLADVAARRRFQRKAKMASSLNHPHIVTVYDAGEFEGRQYLVTEFVDGGTLSDWAKAEKRPWHQIVELLVGVADALASAHSVSMTHRDIKPANILVAKNGYAKLADFGLAKLTEIATSEQETRTLTDRVTRPGVIVGTIAYMSPEQAASKPVDARSDIFSFGVVMYELLTGRRPFAGDTDLELLQNIVHGSPRPLSQDIPPRLRLVIEKALEKEPADRYQAIQEMVVDLRRLVRQSGETRTLMTRSSRWLRWAGAAAAITLLIAVVTTLIVFRGQQTATTAPLQYTQLTNLDFAVQPALSSDGHLMAFVHGPETSVAWMGSPSEIYVKFLPSGDPVQLTHDGVPNKFAPRFSPDGTRITYSTLGDSHWTPWVVPVLGGQEPRKFLANAEGLTWIPQRTAAGISQSILLFSYMTGKGITMAVASSTESRSEQRTVFMEEGVMDHFSYLSPDGKQLLLVEMCFNGWQPCRVAPFDGSSKGKKVGPRHAQCDAAAWSPDGKWMYFSADTGSGFHIWRQHFPDGLPEQITSGTAEEDGVEFAPDGHSFLTSIGSIQNKLWIHDARGDRQVSSDADSFAGSFSSDGKELYYLVRTAAGANTVHGGLWMLDLESDQRQRLLPDFEIEQYDVSRDGKRVVFVSAETARPGVWLAPIDGGSPPRQLTSSHGLQAFFGTSGNVFLAIQERDGTFVYGMIERGEDSHRVIPHAVLFLYGPSPDGKSLAVWGGPSEETVNAVLVYPAGSGSPEIICGACAFRSSSPQQVSWSPDGKLLYLAAMGGQAVFAIPLFAKEVLPALPRGGLRTVEEIAALPGAAPLPKPFAVAGPKPSVYVYPKFTVQRNIYRVPVP
jgi:serine/threonine protein kinase